jgi:RNA polymerase sigma factor (sigma-70 family)
VGVVRAYEKPQFYVRKCATNLWRRRAGRYAREAPRAEPQRADAWHDPGQDVTDRLDLQAAVRALPTRLREVVILRHVETLSVEETAEILGISSGAVKRYSHEGLQRLAELLNDGWNGEEDPQ